MKTASGALVRLFSQQPQVRPIKVRPANERPSSLIKSLLWQQMAAGPYWREHRHGPLMEVAIVWLTHQRDEPRPLCTAIPLVTKTAGWHGRQLMQRLFWRFGAGLFSEPATAQKIAQG
jgi:hypothetical protein